MSTDLSGGAAGGVASNVTVTNTPTVTQANPAVSPANNAIVDGAGTGFRATVSAFHNTDNQALGGAAYGILGGGVAQLLNAANNLDRQRETGGDGIAAVGIPTGTQQLASPFQTTVAAALAATGSQVVTPAAMSGTTVRGGAAWSIQVGSVLMASNANGANSERVVVTAVTGTTFTAVFASTKTAGWLINSYVFNQARDATVSDGATGQGFSAGATYLFNAALNNGVGGWEAERSALGELDGASGAGTAVAAEFEYNSGGPLLASGLPSNLAYDRARNLQGKARLTATPTTTVIGNTSVVFASAAATNTIQPGAPLTLSIPGTPPTSVETVYVTATWVPGSSATVPLVSPVVSGGQTLAAWDGYNALGPALNGFSPVGLGIEEEALYDPISGLYYIERAATSDNAPPQNVVMENEALWNGTGMDRARTNMAVTVLPSAAYTTTQTSADQLNVNGHFLHVILNVTAISGTGASVTIAINGKDPASGLYYPILTGVAVTATGLTVLRVGNGFTPAANSVANDIIPRTFQIVATIAGTTPSVTASVGYNLGE